MTVALFLELLQQGMEIWRHGYRGVDVATPITALLIVLAALLLQRWVVRSVLRLVRRLAARSGLSGVDRGATAVAPSLSKGTLLLGAFLAFSVFEASPAVGKIALSIFSTLGLALLFYGASRLVRAFADDIIHGLARKIPKEFATWATRLLHLSVVLMAGVTILESWGIAVGPLVAGLGLFGVAVALGAQDLFKNLIAGFLILSEKRFSVGDSISVDTVVEGTVESIGFRSTQLRRFDKTPLYVPNTTLSDSAVINITTRSHRRITWLIGLDYRTTEAQLRTIRTAIAVLPVDNPDYAQSPEVTNLARVDQFGPSSIDIALFFYTNSTEWAEWMRIKEELAFSIKRIVEEAGSSFAFPSQSIYVETLPKQLMPRS